MQIPFNRLSLKSDNAVCKSISFNDKHQVIEEPDEPKGSCPVLNERVGKRFPARLNPEIRAYWVGCKNQPFNEVRAGSLCLLRSHQRCEPAFAFFVCAFP